MTTAPKLEPCPFDCDNHAGGTVIDGPWGGGRQVMCNSCNARGPICETDGEAIAEWNRRAAPSAGLREALEQCEKTLSKASRMLTDEYRVVLNGKVWGEKALHAARAALTLSKEGGSALTPHQTNARDE